MPESRSKAFPRHQKKEPATMAQSDACQTGGQEVENSIPAGSDNILSWILIMKYFLFIHSLPLIQERQLSVSGERMCTSTY